MFLILVSVWFCISVPLTLMRGFIGTTKMAKPLPYPTRTNHIPRQLPMSNLLLLRPFKSPLWLDVLMLGFVLFDIFENEPLSLTLSRILSIWHGRFYSAFGDLTLLLMFVVFCAEASVVFTYTLLCSKDWRWWWKTFFASGSVGFYVFLDSINYITSKVGGSNGPDMNTLYVGYFLITAVTIMLATGAFGFLVSFYFVHYLYSSVKMSC